MCSQGPLSIQTDIDRSVIGEDEDTQWKVFGTLHDAHLDADDIDDERLLIVGKIKRKLERSRLATDCRGDRFRVRQPC